MSTFFAQVFKWILMLSTVVMIGAYFFKDVLPDPDYYQLDSLKDPVQIKTYQKAFSVVVNEQTYNIQPKYFYELQGVVVSYHNADAMWDIYHHGQWKDFLNVRDLCVIWGNNVKSGVYKNMDYDNDTWTCWAYWPDYETKSRFTMKQLSNNHILSNKENVNQVLMSAEPGDHIRFKGVLAEYSNPGSGFNRGTSTNRNDTGNGACETIYIDEFEIIKKANVNIRTLYSSAKWTVILSLTGFIIMFLIAPVSRR